MNESIFEQPPPELLNAFVAGDPLAEDRVIKIVLPQLVKWAISKHPLLDQAEIQSEIHKVIAETCRPAVRYDPGKSKITTYLINLIKLRLKDLRPNSSKVIPLHDLESSSREKHIKSLYKEIDPSSSIIRQNFFNELSPHLTPLEQAFLELMIQGEKSTSVFSEALAKYEDISDPEKDVKNAKVRLQRKLKKLAQNTDYELGDLLDS